MNMRSLLVALVAILFCGCTATKDSQRYELEKLAFEIVLRKMSNTRAIYKVEDELPMFVASRAKSFADAMMVVKP